MYRNFIRHDTVSGTIATARKEELLREIKRQRELGDASLLEEDKFLAKVNLEGLEDTSGERQHYWLLAIKTARKTKIHGGRDDLILSAKLIRIAPETSSF